MTGKVVEDPNILRDNNTQINKNNSSQDFCQNCVDRYQLLKNRIKNNSIGTRFFDMKFTNNDDDNNNHNNTNKNSSAVGSSNKNTTNNETSVELSGKTSSTNVEHSPGENSNQSAVMVDNQVYNLSLINSQASSELANTLGVSQLPKNTSIGSNHNNHNHHQNNDNEDYKPLGSNRSGLSGLHFQSTSRRGSIASVTNRVKPRLVSANSNISYAVQKSVKNARDKFPMPFYAISFLIFTGFMCKYYFKDLPTLHTDGIIKKTLQPPLSSYGLIPHCYLYLNYCNVTWYIFYSFCNLLSILIHHTTQKNRFKHSKFSSLLFLFTIAPSSIFTCLYFWFMYMLNYKIVQNSVLKDSATNLDVLLLKQEEMVIRPELIPYTSSISLHISYTLPMIFSLIEVAIMDHNYEYLRKRYLFSCCFCIVLVYHCWLMVIYIESGEFPYGFLDLMWNTKNHLGFILNFMFSTVSWAGIAYLVLYFNRLFFRKDSYPFDFAGNSDGFVDSEGKAMMSLEKKISREQQMQRSQNQQVRHSRDLNQVIINEY